MRKVKIPSKIQVGGLVFTVRYNKALGSISHNGFCKTEEQLLELRPSMPKQRELGTLIHEIVHAIGVVYLDDVLTEAQVDALGHGLHQVLIQLPVDFVVTVEGDNK